ncbi:RodZ domain-containing protein [Marinobacter sp. DY40_1A1]|uniref:RodZ domain-containing protein n=1 Tax=Marinobacter sp. DY40_1A1 TaxID=2583229 RepID=UPI001905D592|nr:RodZ domain-containing protein [Marinobacter sp. DY40_1A1]MBK1887689.1 helix-turn-helix domain-containing protein [Marinobacter sp. DY40_1A1]
MTSDDSQQNAAKEAVGQQLKRAREKQGLSIAQIADAQHLRNGVVQAIENGDYAQIDSELFLKGYVRAYAKQVGLDADAIIADLNVELEPARIQKAREMEANPLIDIERRRRRKRRIAKLFLLIVAIVAMGALIVTFVVPKFTAGQADAELPASTDIMAQPDDAVPEDEVSLPVEPSGDDAGSGEGVTDSGYLDEANAEGSEVFDSQAEQVVEPEVTGQIPAVAQTIEPALVQVPVSDETGPVSGMLEIAFTGDCWVQVRDASGNRLASSLQRAGDTLQVSGKAPLKVVIGAVSTVDSIRFQGETVDIRDFPVVNNRSEFTLTI